MENSLRTVSYSQKQLFVYPFVPSINQGEKVKYILSLPMQDFFFCVYCTEDSNLGIPFYAGLSPLDQSLVSCYLWTFKIQFQADWDWLVILGNAWCCPPSYRFEVSQRNTLAPHKLNHALRSSLIFSHDFQIYWKDLTEYLFYHITKTIEVTWFCISKSPVHIMCVIHVQ